MLSWTLRRKSAPLAVDAEPRVDSALPSEEPSPSKSPCGRSRSLSSKGSLSSLFSSFKRDHSAKLMDPAEVVDVVEASHYPIYDPSNPNHNPLPSPPHRQSTTSSSRPGSRSPRSSRRRTGSMSSLQSSRNILDTIAAKMKAATELFHRDTSESQTSEGSRHSKSSSTRSPSPKKSVRFRSGTFSNDSAATSSPIDVPTKATPFLPHLKLPSEDFLTTLANDSTRDPIPTGRPQDSPFLKDKRDSDYFFPFPTEIDSQLDRLRGQRGVAKPLPLIDLEKRASTEENPFSDAAALAESPTADCAAAGPIDTPAAESIMKPELTPTGSLGRQSIAQEWSRFSPSRPPSGDDDNHHARVESESNVTNPFCTSTEAFDALRFHPSTEAPTVQDDQSTSPSVWGLESRTISDVGRLGRCDGDYHDDSDSSDDTIAHLRRRPVPTHEDIRHQFRTRRSRGQKIEDPGQLAATNSHVQRHEESVAPQSDPMKHSPGNSSSPLQTGASSQPEEVPDSAVSPLNLRSNVSSMSPSRARRPFRFSNKTPSSPSTDIGTTQFGWEGHKLPSQVYGAGRLFEDKTPSPVAIPLPLSVALKHRGPTKWRDQHGWTPFGEQRFPEAILESRDIHDILGRPGGFAHVWTLLGLPDATRPEDDTKALTEIDIREMLRACVSMRVLDRTSSPESSDGPGDRSTMPELFGSAKQIRHHSSETSTTDDSSMIAEFPPLGRSPRKYSGEVSTINDMSTSADNDDTDTSCSHCKSNSSSCRCSESTQTSTETQDSEVPSSPPGGVSPEEKQFRQAVSTPTRYPPKRSSISPLKSASLDTTPKQSDFSKRQSRLPIRERSNATTETSTTDSDEENYIKGII